MQRFVFLVAAALIATPTALPAAAQIASPPSATPPSAQLPTAGPRPSAPAPQSTSGAQATSGPALPGAPRSARQTSADGVSRNAPVNGVLTLYGNERCPTNADGAEVVVCVRRSAAEQFRIPKELREFEITPENAAWATKVDSTLGEGVGASSVGSCSTIGPGGQTGCQIRNIRRSKAEATARSKAATPDLP